MSYVIIRMDSAGQDYTTFSAPKTVANPNNILYSKLFQDIP